MHDILRDPLPCGKRRNVQRLRHPNVDVQSTFCRQWHAWKMGYHGLLPHVVYSAPASLTGLASRAKLRPPAKTLPIFLRQPFGLTPGPWIVLLGLPQPASWNQPIVQAQAGNILEIGRIVGVGSGR